MTNKRLDAIRQRLLVMRNAPQTHDLDVVICDFDCLLSLVEKQRQTLIDLKHQSHHTIEEEMWRIDEALKCDEGGEVRE